MSDLHMEPITYVEVASLLVTCGSCGHSHLIEYEALDQDSGRVNSAHDFGECEECGCLIDASAATFSAMIIEAP